MYDDDDLLPVSALQHLLFCPRQCALIHVERQWAENRFTAEGNQLHRKVHEPEAATRAGVRAVRGLALRSYALGLRGKSDLVEFHWQADEPAPDGPSVPDVLTDSNWRPYPVEYKRGKAKPNDCDRVQLCAQALCLEEMLLRDVPAGAVFYGRPRRRLNVEFTSRLREDTRTTARQLHALMTSGRTPPPDPGAKCRSCSLSDICLPHGTGPRRSAARFLQRALSGETPSPPTEDPDP